jgi:hypothetical protein
MVKTAELNRRWIEPSKHYELVFARLEFVTGGSGVVTLHACVCKDMCDAALYQLSYRRFRWRNFYRSDLCRLLTR